MPIVYGGIPENIMFSEAYQIGQGFGARVLAWEIMFCGVNNAMQYVMSNAARFFPFGTKRLENRGFYA